MTSCSPSTLCSLLLPLMARHTFFQDRRSIPRSTPLVTSLCSTGLSFTSSVSSSSSSSWSWSRTPAATSRSRAHSSTLSWARTAASPGSPVRTVGCRQSGQSMTVLPASPRPSLRRQLSQKLCLQCSSRGQQRAALKLR